MTAQTCSRKRRASESESPPSMSECFASGSFNNNPSENLKCTSTWTIDVLNKLKIVTTTTKIYTPMQLITRAYCYIKFDSEMDNNIQKFKEHILVRSPLHMLDFDCFKSFDVAFALQMKSWLNQFILDDPWNKGTEVQTGNDIRLWHMFHTHGEQFAQQLVYMSMKQGNGPLTQYMHQILFQHFVGLFGLSFIAYPQLDGHEIKIGHVEVTSIPDVVFPCFSTNKEEIEVIAICDVKSNFNEESQTSSDERKKVHLDDNLLGQIGGDLLAHLPLSKNQRGLLGIIVQATYVTFCHLDCTLEQFVEIKTGNPDFTVNPEMCFTRPYNFLKASDRQELIEPLLKLGFIQRMQMK